MVFASLVLSSQLPSVGQHPLKGCWCVYCRRDLQQSWWGEYHVNIPIPIALFLIMYSYPSWDTHLWSLQQSIMTRTPNWGIYMLNQNTNRTDNVGPFMLEFQNSMFDSNQVAKYWKTPLLISQGKGHSSSSQVQSSIKGILHAWTSTWRRPRLYLSDLQHCFKLNTWVNNLHIFVAGLTNCHVAQQLETRDSSSN